MNRIRPKRAAAILATATILSVTACGGHSNNPADTSTATHHSKLAGAALGAVAGHVVGGTRGAVAGAVIGAEIQHHRNKAYERTHP